MLKRGELEGCAQKLYVYDVVQGGWEHEKKGLAVNTTHVLTHLTKDLIQKSFTQEVIVREAIAPDSVQYALRLGRWAKVEPFDVWALSHTFGLDAQHAAKKWGGNVHRAAFAQGTWILANYLHDSTHASTKEAAKQHRVDSLRTAGGYLLHCAEVASQTFDFDLVEAFEARLDGLRERFNIPQPEG